MENSVVAANSAPESARKTAIKTYPIGVLK